MRIVTALKIEALPIIEFYQLKRIEGNLAFPIYTNGNLFLVVSGIGKVRSAAATSYLHVKSGNLENQPYLNIGIAGHHSTVTDTAVIANKITDQAAGNSWYPSQLIFDSLERSALVTVDTVESQYKNDSAYDMEASGYHPIALRITSAELVQTLKVISDNPVDSAETLDSIRIETLIGNHIDKIDSFSRHLQTLSHAITSSAPEYWKLQPFLERWHFSVTQEHQLRKILVRWSLLTQKENPLTSIPLNCKNANQAIKTLENELLARPMNLHTKTYQSKMS